MAFRFSTKVRNDMLGLKATCNQLVTGVDIAIVDGGAGNDTITQVANGLGSFEVGDKVTIQGSAADDGSYEILAVAAGQLDIPTGSITGEAAGNQIILGSARGGSLVDQFRNMTMKIFTGSQPATADDAESGSELIQITESSGAFTGGSSDNGINFGQVADAELHTADGEVWSGKATATGTAGWFRIYDNAAIGGADDQVIDGAIATSGSQMNMANTAITTDGTTTIDEVNIPMAESA